jgi:hypothetical protein
MLAQRQSESRSGYIEVKTRQKRKLTRVALTLKKINFAPRWGVWCLRVWSL